MENHQQQQPAFVVNGVVSSQNSHGIRGTQQSPDAEISDNSAENFHTDSPADMVNIIDQIMGREPPPAFQFPADGSAFPADSSYTSASSNGMNMNNGTHSASLNSNYIFPVNDMMQQSSIYASSNDQTNWQGNSPGNQFGQNSVISPTLFSTQSYNSFQTNASTIPNIRNARQVALFGNSGRRATFGSGTSARIGLEFNNFTSNEPQSAHSVSSTSGGSTGSIGSSRLENHLQQMLPFEDTPTCNRIYDPHHAELGMPVDPYLRMFNHAPEFWKNVHGNGDLPKK